ncbi:hypothetical protein ETD83_04180 [Actinomadura soli]|uniref:Uncharacterized protein n=1 Tax=Actinomadura soli TaxID=2508997 RepID=A0A5C4JI06_9ACTN|nr:hypothetical protein [Actinomadura soli]TMR06538.1 hypothetical protein ETD83_04180 [Actinomadura soli]
MLICHAVLISRAEELVAPDRRSRCRAGRPPPRERPHRWPRPPGWIPETSVSPAREGAYAVAVATAART